MKFEVGLENDCFFNPIAYKLRRRYWWETLNLVLTDDDWIKDRFWTKLSENMLDELMSVVVWFKIQGREGILQPWMPWRGNAVGREDEEIESWRLIWDIDQFPSFLLSLFGLLQRTSNNNSLIFVSWFIFGT